MASALIVAVLSVVAGAVLGWWGRSGPVLAPVRTFALVTSVAVALAQLLPDALAAIGVLSLPVFLAGLFVPTVMERLLASREEDGQGSPEARADHPGGVRAAGAGGPRILSKDVIGLEIGFAGLVLHEIGDGLALGTYTSELHAGHLHTEVLIAIGIHTVPIVALVFLVYTQRKSVRSAVARSFVLGAAKCAGVLLASAAGLEALHEVEPWITAAVAGTLLHVVFHDWRSVPNGTPPGARRVGDLLALAMGAALVAMGGAHSHAEGDASVRASLGDALLGVALVSAPIVLVALTLDGWFRAIADRGARGSFARRWLGLVDARFQKIGALLLAMAIAAAFVAAAATPRAAELARTASGPVSWLAVVAVLGLALRGIWKRGLRGWLGG